MPGCPCREEQRLSRAYGRDGDTSRARERMPMTLLRVRPEMIEKQHEDERIPGRGERIELRGGRLGVCVRGTVFYSDHVQILVKWDDGRSTSLRPGIDRFRIVGDE